MEMNNMGSGLYRVYEVKKKNRNKKSTFCHFGDKKVLFKSETDI